MLETYRLPLNFDPDLLLQELLQIESRYQWHNHPDYTVAENGAWKAVALVSQVKNINDPNSLRHRTNKLSAGPTEILQGSLYLQKVISTFKTNVHRARLMNLRPGTRILEHRDYGNQRYSLERGYVRIHIPIRTHPDVLWKLRGRTIPMHPGEVWYLNVCLPHSVENNSSVNRVHLVLDMKLNDWLYTLFPRQSYSDQLYGLIVRNYEQPVLKIRRRSMALASRYKEILGDMGLRRLRDTLTKR